MNQKISKYILITSVTSALLFSGLATYAHAEDLETLKEKAMMRAEQAKERMEEMREQAKERAMKARENAQEKINQIKDQKKQEAANKISNQLNRINEVWTNHFANVLDRLDAILQKIQSRTDKAEDNGQDVSSVNTAIQKAETAITNARTAVTNQAQKTYDVNTSNLVNPNSTEASQNSLVSQLRDQFKTLRDQLRKDLTSLRDGAIKDARSAVHDAFQALRQVPKVDDEPETNT